ncbi:MAG: hypothetical protein ACI4ES_07485 [Roseburia sp.]
MKFYYIITFIFVAIVAYIITKSVREESQKRLDERQRTEQLKGYRFGFFSILLFLVIYALIGSVMDLSWFTPEAVTMTGIVVGASAFGGYSILKGAYFLGRDKKSNRNLYWLFGIVGIMNLWLATSKILAGQMVVEGELASNYINLLTGILFMVVFVTSCIKDLKDRKEE